MMRLDRLQKAAVWAAIEGVSGEVFLFGSRVDDAVRGGDVDLLILTHEEPYLLSKQVKRRFTERCEERLDVVVMDPDRLSEEQEAFLHLIERERLR